MYLCDRRLGIQCLISITKVHPAVKTRYHTHIFHVQLGLHVLQVGEPILHVPYFQGAITYDCFQERCDISISKVHQMVAITNNILRTFATYAICLLWRLK